MNNYHELAYNYRELINKYNNLIYIIKFNYRVLIRWLMV